VLIGDLLDVAAGALPRRPAVSLLDRSLTFGEVAVATDRTANALVGLGVRPGDRVASWTDIGLGSVPLRFATARLGAVFAPLNPAYTEAEATATLEYLTPRLVVADVVHAEAAAAAAHGLPLAVSGSDGRTAPGTDFDAAVAAASAAPPEGPRPGADDDDVIFLTSGSTGRPKGVVLSHRATLLRAISRNTSPNLGDTGEVCMFPLFHMAGWHFLERAWAAGRAIHLVPRADAELLLETVETWRASSIYCIPAVWNRIFECHRTFDTSSLEWVFTGTSLVSAELLATLKERFSGTRTTVNYGSTEAGPSVSLPDADLFTKIHSVGLPVPGTKARLADDDELLLSSDWLMSRYYELPDETAAALREGWYHTGDLAERDDEGYYWIVGRKREIIRTGGESVAPVEVEGVLRGYAGLRDVAVAGVADERWGEVVCAFVVTEPGRAAPTVDELRSHIGDRLAPFKHPRRVVVTEQLPRTPATGQIQRSVLARLAEEASPGRA